MRELFHIDGARYSNVLTASSERWRRLPVSVESIVKRRHLRVPVPDDDAFLLLLLPDPAAHHRNSEFSDAMQKKTAGAIVNISQR